MQSMLNATNVMEHQETQSLVPSVKRLYNPGELGECPTLLDNPCFCNPGDYCVRECIGLDERVNIASGEDVALF